MSEDLPKEQRSIPERTAVFAEEIFNKLPFIYKRFITFDDWLMVLGGLKGMTDFHLPETVWNKEEFEQLQKIFETAGVKVSEVKMWVSKGGNFIRDLLVYNPETLRKSTAESRFAPPYNGVEPLSNYVREARKSGYPYAGIVGKMYSFPESAINDFVSREAEGREMRKVSSLGNETYLAIPPFSPDIEVRERQKMDFLTKLLNTPEIKRIKRSNDLKKSNEEWTKKWSESPDTQVSLLQRVIRKSMTGVQSFFNPWDQVG